MAGGRDLIEDRLARIERTNRVLMGIASTMFLLTCSALLVGFSQSEQRLRSNAAVFRYAF